MEKLELQESSDLIHQRGGVFITLSFYARLSCRHVACRPKKKGIDRVQTNYVLVLKGIRQSMEYFLQLAPVT